MSTRRVVLIGIGSVGSTVAEALASCGLLDFRLVDGAELEEHNIARHVLKRPYIHQNKAEAMAKYLFDSFPPDAFTVIAVPRHVDGSMSDHELDELLEGADVVVAATDNRRAQRKVAERALANDVPAVLPGLYPNGGGEVFVSFGPRTPCFLCWDAFRTEQQTLRGVSALGVEAASVVALTMHLILGLLDESSEFARLYAHEPRDPIPQLFVIERPHAAIAIGEVGRAPNCTMCQVGPAAGPAMTSPRDRADTSLRQAEVLQETSLFAWAVFLVFLVIAAATANVVAILLLAMASVACPFFVMRPSQAETMTWIAANDFVSAATGLALVALLVFSLASHNAALIVLLGVALAASSTALFAQSRAG
jgi:molybdopterin/thiamine biosynthesis adenylyltransferase